MSVQAASSKPSLNARKGWISREQVVRLLADSVRRETISDKTEVIEAGWEGFVAKDPESSYVGGRTLKWLKVKQCRHREGERGREPGR
jgi:hypothetical protein